MGVVEHPVDGRRRPSSHFVSFNIMGHLLSKHRKAVEAPTHPLRNEELFQAGDFSIDEYRPMKVVCIGAGFSGITAGIRSVYSLDRITCPC